MGIIVANNDKTVAVRNACGDVVAEITPIPTLVRDLKEALRVESGVAPALQVLMDAGRICEDDDHLPCDEDLELLFLFDDTATYTWDHEGNPDRHFFEVEGSVVRCPSLRRDYCNVLTKEPLSSGLHYIEFHMHHIGDEQWCGLVPRAEVAGTAYGGRYLAGWTYYCGRMGSESGSLRDGKGALQVAGRIVTEFKKLQPKGDVIGMLADLDSRAVAFDLNGDFQGAVKLPDDGPMWVITHLDTPQDCVELRKRDLQEAPPAHLEAMKNALLDVAGAPRIYDI